MLLHVASVALGAAVLYLGAEWLVKGAAGLARALGVRPLVVGLTVMALGTSAPELVVSAVAAHGGRGALAFGNVVGSNIANLGLILGLTAVLAPVAVEATLIRREVPALVATTLALPWVLWDGRLSRLDAGLLVLAAAAFTAWLARSGRGAAESTAGVAERDAEAAGAPPGGGRLRLAVIAVVGLGLLVGGGKLFVDGASRLALALGMSERLVGLTIVAVGTSVPELASSLVAARRGHAALAVGNVVGSNIFNVLLVLGAAGLVRPIEGAVHAMRFDLGALGVLTVIGAVLLRSERRISRAEGAVLVVAYAVALAVLARSG